MFLEPFGSEEFQAKIASLWPGLVRPDGTMETIKALYDEVGEEIADAIAWCFESPDELIGLKKLYVENDGKKWAHWMSLIIRGEYHQHSLSKNLGKFGTSNGTFSVEDVLGS